MGKAKWIRIAGCILGILAIGTGTVYAMSSLVFTNHFETGHVDIQVDGYQRKEDREIPWRSDGIVLPGDQISCIPRITNEGAECYVRAKVSLVSEEGREMGGQDGIRLTGMEEQWIKAEDGYYYHQDPLLEGQSVDIFQGIRFPSDLSQEELENTQLELTVQVDAIQGANMTQDLSAPEPWGTVEILNYEKKDIFEISQVTSVSTSAFRMIYVGNTGQWITNSQDLFAHVDKFMPGDVYRDSITVDNDRSAALRLYWRGESREELPWLEQIALKIGVETKGEKKLVYEGSLTGAEITEDLLLCTVPGHETTEIWYEIQVPVTLDNSVASEDMEICWTFSSEQVTEHGTTAGETSSPATGDPSRILLYVGSMAGSLILLSGLAWRMQRGKRNEKTPY